MVRGDWSQVRTLSEADFRAEAEPSFSAVFQSADPFDEPLQPSIPRRGILSPFGPLLGEVDLKAVCAAVEAIGEDGFYVTNTERPVPERQPEFPYDWHWWLPLRGVEAYRHLRFAAVENALYSRAATWGIICSHEMYAIVGGPPDFVDTLYAHLPEPEGMQVRTFTEEWKKANEIWGSRVDWVPRVLAHTYGATRARITLETAGFPSDPARWIGRYPREGDPA